MRHWKLLHFQSNAVEGERKSPPTIEHFLLYTMQKVLPGELVALLLASWLNASNKPAEQARG